MATKEVRLRDDREGEYIDTLSVDVREEGDIFIFQYMRTSSNDVSGLVHMRPEEVEKLVNAVGGFTKKQVEDAIVSGITHHEYDVQPTCERVGDIQDSIHEALVNPS